MAQMPQPLVGGNQAFQGTPAVLLGWNTAPRQHRFESFEQLLGNHQILRVARVMERDKNLVRQTPALPRTTGTATIATFVANPVLFSKFAHARPAGRPGNRSNSLDILSLAPLGI